MRLIRVHVHQTYRRVHDRASLPPSRSRTQLLGLRRKGGLNIHIYMLLHAPTATRFQYSIGSLKLDQALRIPRSLPRTQLLGLRHKRANADPDDLPVSNFVKIAEGAFGALHKVEWCALVYTSPGQDEADREFFFFFFF